PGYLPRARSWYLKKYLRRSFLRRSLLYSARSRRPGSVARRWGVVQLVGHLTVNEDGEGSNPSAPANSPGPSTLGALVFGNRQSRFQPALPTAVHRFDVVVAHFL